MRFAITGTDDRFTHLRALLLADGHTETDPSRADVIVPPPWDRGAHYAHSESYLLRNAALTAEGAAALLAKERSLEGAQVLILGFGRVGSLCAHALHRAGCIVTVAARADTARAWIEGYGYAALDTARLGDAVSKFDILVNTVPAPLLTEDLIQRLKADALLLELASAPGGIDAAAAREQGKRYLRAPGLPGKYAPDRAAVILRDALYEVLREPKPRLGFAMTGSHCSFDKALTACAPLARYYELVPVLSPAAAETDTYFGTAAEFRARLESLCGRSAITTIADAEPLGAKTPLDALLVAPCTGNTLAKLAHGVTDTAVTMACKAHLRNGRPLVLALSTNDGLSGSAENIARLLQRKNVFFVPFRQDAPGSKPYSLQSDFSLCADAVEAARRGEQLQPVLL